MTSAPEIASATCGFIRGRRSSSANWRRARIGYPTIGSPRKPILVASGQKAQIADRSRWLTRYENAFIKTHVISGNRTQPEVLASQTFMTR